jgi:hypothetical protein
MVKFTGIVNMTLLVSEFELPGSNYLPLPKDIAHGAFARFGLERKANSIIICRCPDLSHLH